MAGRDTWSLQRDTLIDRNALKMERSSHGQPEDGNLEKSLITSLSLGIIFLQHITPKGTILFNCQQDRNHGAHSEQWK
jgi:hypothetical protein